jgi:hypothetical protein
MEQTEAATDEFSEAIECSLVRLGMTRTSKSLIEITDDIEREGDAKRMFQDPERTHCLKLTEMGAEGRGVP